MRYLFVTAGIAVLLFIGCATITTSPGERLMETNSELHRQLKGSWYILSEKAFGDIEYELIFNPDGSITGDMGFLGDTSARYLWVADLTNYKGPRPRVNLDYDEITIYKERGAGDPEIIGKIFPIKGSSLKTGEFPSRRNNLPDTSIYNNHIPPLKVLSFVTGELFSSNSLTIHTVAYSRSLTDIYTARENYKSTLPVGQSIEPDAIKEQEKQKLASINKKSARDIVAFINEAKIPENKAEAEKLLAPLIDKNVLDGKVKTYLKKYYRELYQYLNYTIYHRDGKAAFPFYQFFRIPVLGINPVTGFKQEFEAEVSGKEIIISFNSVSDNRPYSFTFRPYRDRLTITGYQIGYNINQKGWETAAAILANIFSAFPANDKIDFDLIEKLP